MSRVDRTARGLLAAGLMAWASLVAGCGDSAEGQGALDIRNPAFFSFARQRHPSIGANPVTIQVKKCGRTIEETPYREQGWNQDSAEYHRARVDFERYAELDAQARRETCESAYEIEIDFTFDETIRDRAFDVRCRNLEGERLRCVGHDRGLEAEFGPVRYVSLTEGGKLLGFQIWQLASERGAPASSRTQLIATFGAGSEFVPR